MKKSKQKRQKHEQFYPAHHVPSPSQPTTIPSCCQLAASCPECYTAHQYISGNTHSASYRNGGTGTCHQQQIYQNAPQQNDYRAGGAGSSHQTSPTSVPITKPTNIVATMELFEPRTSASSATSPPRYHPHQDYSYAYYEPGVPLRHSNIPSYMFDPNAGGPSSTAGPSTPRTPLSSLVAGSSSMRTLMALGGSGQRNRLYARRTSVGSAGRFPGSPCENIYEEIIHEENEREGGIVPGTPSGRLSLMSLNQSVIVEEEFRQVHQCHRKVLGELNLSVEAMLMAEETPSRNNDCNRRGVSNYRRKSSGGTGQCTDLDSGFSGSSGSTCYIGNLRAKKTEARMLSLKQQSHHQSMMLLERIGQEDTRSIASSHSADRSYGSIKAICKGKNLSKWLSGSTRSLRRMKETGEPSRKGTHSTPSSPTFVKSSKGGFWSRKGWSKRMSSSGALHSSFEGKCVCV
ncbi:uncharacterized protein LOC131689939 [Topomyia yanbarensis]|uniref:uncharacterized protein LOC131689939 n=1 Tax=Topomyia yanbarensis TaxID=2498891 RepID=UPI00273A8E9D|nr:uncharacterized protein LOC131689939 [Topomyia yanbarensis]